MPRQFLVVSYDISDNRQRRKVMNTLEDYGKRVQFSVFECRLLPAEIKRLQKRLLPFVTGVDDSIRFYFIGADDVNRIQLIGAGQVTEDQAFFLM